MRGEPVMYGETGDLKFNNRISTVDSDMDHHNENHTRRLKRKKFDIRSSEFNSSKQSVNKLVNGLKFGDEVDADWARFLNFMDETNEHTKPSIEEVSKNKDEDEDEDDNDPQYSMFLKELTDNGKSYKLKVSRNNEAPRFLEYHKQGSSDGCGPPTNSNISNFNYGDKLNSSEDTRDMEIKETVEYLPNKRRLNREKMKISMLEEGSVKNKVEHKRVTVDSCSQTFLDGRVSSKYGAFVYEGEQVNYEEKVMCSDSDVLIWDNVKGCSTVNNSQRVTAEKYPSILRQPYNEEEYEELLVYVEQEKPIRRLLPLRYKTISSVVDASLTKSILDDVCPSFRIKLDASRNEPAKALNLLRGFRFWLEHVPNEGAFTPWLDEDCLKVLPSSCTR